MTFLAHRVGMDTIEVAGGLAGHGVKHKVAVGNLDEREAASRAVRGNARRGCVLDLLAFWTAWRLEALDAVRSTCGPIQLPQSVLDRLRGRREQFEFSARNGHKSAGYEDGRIVLHEVSAEAVAGLRDEIDRAIAWAEANAMQFFRVDPCRSPFRRQPGRRPPWTTSIASLCLTGRYGGQR